MMMNHVSENQQLFADWLAEHRESVSTYKAYRSASDRFARFLANRPIAQIQPEEMLRFVHELENDSNLSFSSVQAYKAAIRSFLNHVANRPDLLALLPITHAKRSKLPDVYVDFRLNDVIAKELNARNRVLLCLTVLVRCSPPELLGLTWQDVDCYEQSLILRNSSATRRSSNQPRKAFLVDPLWSEFMALRQDRPDNAHVFHGPKGTRLAAFQLNQIIAEALARVGIVATPRDVYFSLKSKERDYQLVPQIPSLLAHYRQIPVNYSPSTASIQVGGSEVIRVDKDRKVPESIAALTNSNLTDIVLYWDGEPVYVLESSFVTLDRLQLIARSFELPSQGCP